MFGVLHLQALNAEMALLAGCTLHIRRQSTRACCCGWQV